MSTAVGWLHGCATALVTPFEAGGAVDLPRMRALVERQITGGVRLLVPCGTTGERATMNDEEGRRVIAATIEVARGRARVVAGAGSNNTTHAIEQAREAAALGADGVGELIACRCRLAAELARRVDRAHPRPNPRATRQTRGRAARFRHCVAVRK